MPQVMQCQGRRRSGTIMAGLSAHLDEPSAPVGHPRVAPRLLPILALASLALLVLITACSLSSFSRGKPQADSGAVQNGLSYMARQSAPFSSPEAERSLSSLAATGANWLSLIVFGYQDTIDSTTITYTTKRTDTDSDLAHVIKGAHQLGLRVMLKPHVDLLKDPAHWRGQIGQDFRSEAQWSLWFASYRDFIEHYAALAQRHGVEQFAVGTELSATAGREADWRTVIASVRKIYDGPLTYAANHGGEEMEIRWWDAVDYIGVDAYYRLADRDNPTAGELEAAWRSRIASLDELASSWNKPILFTEIGYRSINGATRRPSDWQREAPLDLQEQADAYQAVFETVYNQPWFAGLFWWVWSTDPARGGPADDGYSPYGKPAEAILRSWYASPRPG